MRSIYALLLATLLIGYPHCVSAKYHAVHGSFILGRVATSGDPARKAVALSFDDGPNPDATPEILNTLEREHAVATFFVVGRVAERYPELLKRMARDGDAIENHSWKHEYTVAENIPRLKASIRRTDEVIEAATGATPKYFRPPYGVRAPWSVHAAHAAGKTVVLWSTALSHDWLQPGVALIVKRSLRGLHNGSIIVLHDGNEGRLCAGTPACDRRQEIAATALLVARIQQAGYTLVTIPQLLTAR